MVYHTSPTTTPGSPSLFTMTGEGHEHQMEQDAARVNLLFDFGVPTAWAAIGNDPLDPMALTQDYVTARQYLLQQDLSLLDPAFRPKTSWSLRPKEGLPWDMGTFRFPLTPMKPPVQMVRTTHLSAVREAMMHNRLEVARHNARVPFDTRAGIKPIVGDFKMLSLMEGTVILLERPSKLLMEVIFDDLHKPDHYQIRRTKDGKILSLGLQPEFFTEQSIWLTIPSPVEFMDLLKGVTDEGGNPMDARHSYLDCLAWPFLGIVSTSAAQLYLAFRSVHNGCTGAPPSSRPGSPPRGLVSFLDWVMDILTSFTSYPIYCVQQTKKIKFQIINFKL